MTRRRRIELPFLAAAQWVAAIVADHQHPGHVEFALAISGIAAALVTLLPER